MLELRMFKAQDGDCLLLTHSGANHRRHILVDGGRGSTYRFVRPALEALKQAAERIDLLVLTHVDGDHIGGLLSLVTDPARPVDIGEIWFNGFDQLIGIGRRQALGYRQADAYSAALAAGGLAVNTRFGGGPVVLPDGGMPLRIEFGDGLSITLLSPDASRLRTLAVHWEAWRAGQAEGVTLTGAGRRGLAQPMGRRPMPDPIEVEALATGEAKPDDDPVNGSSIAFVAEADGARVLLCADAHADMLVESLIRLRALHGAYPIDLVKISHHGSKFNTSAALIDAADCRNFAISTDGSHGHPDPETIAKILRHAAAGHRTLWFNYRQDRTLPWDVPRLRRRWGYECRFPEEGSDFLAIPVRA